MTVKHSVLALDLKVLQKARWMFLPRKGGGGGGGGSTICYRHPIFLGQKFLMGIYFLPEFIFLGQKFLMGIYFSPKFIFLGKKFRENIIFWGFPKCKSIFTAILYLKSLSQVHLKLYF